MAILYDIDIVITFFSKLLVLLELKYSYGIDIGSINIT